MNNKKRRKINKNVGLTKTVSEKETGGWARRLLQQRKRKKTWLTKRKKLQEIRRNIYGDFE